MIAFGVGGAALGLAVVLLACTWREIWAWRIVERYLKAAGGREALAAIRDRVVTFRRTPQPSGDAYFVQRYSKRGWKLRESWELSGFVLSMDPAPSFTLMYDGEQDLLRVEGSIRPLDDQEMAVYLDGARVEDFFLRWEDEGFHLEYQEQTSLDGEMVDVVAALPPHGERILYFFSSSDGLLVGKEWLQRRGDLWVPKGERYREYVSIVFSDESGCSVRFPTKVDTYVNGEQELQVMYTGIQVNTGFSDDVFSSP
jgi:hypothetical protein